MAYCSKCGRELRPGLKFCTGCGTPAPMDDEQTQQQSDFSGFSGQGESAPDFGDAFADAPGSGGSTGSAGQNPPQGDPVDTRPTAPTIVIAPIEKKDGKKIAKTVVKTVIGCILVVVLIIGGVWATAWMMSNPFRSSPVEEVNNEKYTRMLALVEDVRNPNFDEVIDDLLTQKGKAENYSFLEEYTNKFNEILGEEYTDEEKLFCDCCYFVWYTEYQAKRYEWLSKNSGLLNALYVGKANTYRGYADTLYDMLCEADSVTDMNNIKAYCADHEIISDNK